MNYRVMALLLLWLFSGPSLAVDDSTKKLAEKQAEDRLCEAKVAGRRDPNDPNWGHMHHFCYALGFQSRAMRTMANPTEFRSNVSQAIDNFNYVLNHTSPGFYMRQEVMIEKAKTLQLARQSREATGLFTKALDFNPALPIGYVALADQYVDLGNKAAALQVVTQGLRRVPESRALQRRYLDLGGKEPFPGALSEQKGSEPQQGQPQPSAINAATDTPATAPTSMPSNVGPASVNSEPSAPKSAK